MKDEQFMVPIPDGGELAVIVDRPQGAPVGRVILVPPFGMNSERMFPVSYLLVQNGFEVFRFDPRSAPGGHSSGQMVDYTMSGLVDDIHAMIDRVPDAILVAISLSARSVTRALAHRDDWRAAVLLTPVVNSHFTVDQAIGWSVFAVRIAGEALPPDLRILGVPIRSTCIDDILQHDLHDVPHAIADLSRCARPVTLIAGDADPWVKIDEVRATVDGARRAGRPVTLVTVEAASHQLYRNPVLALKYFQTAAQECLRVVGRSAERAVGAPFSEIVSAAESVRLRERAQ